MSSIPLKNFRKPGSRKAALSTAVSAAAIVATTASLLWFRRNPAPARRPVRQQAERASIAAKRARSLGIRWADTAVQRTAKRKSAEREKEGVDIIGVVLLALRLVRFARSVQQPVRAIKERLDRSSSLVSVADPTLIRGPLRGSSSQPRPASDKPISASAAMAAKSAAHAFAPAPPPVAQHHRVDVSAIIGLIKGAISGFSAHRASSKGAALALYTLFSLAPILILVIACVGLFFGVDAVRTAILEQMTSLIGPQGADAVKSILESSKLQGHGILASVISFALVLVGATSAFTELKDSLDELWGTPPNATSGFFGMIRERFLSFGLLLVIALLLLLSLTISAGLGAMQNMWGALGSDGALGFVVKAFSEIFSFFVVTALFAAIYKLLPRAKVAWKDVILGAIVTAVLFTVGKLLIGLYLGHGSVSSSYGAAGSVVALIVWIYYSAQIFFFGSLFTYEYAVTFGSRRHDAPNLASGKV